MHFQWPVLGRLGTKRHRKALQALTAGHQHREAILPARGLTLHLRDEEAPVVRARHQAEPGFGRRGRGEAEAEAVERLGIVEFLSRLQAADKPGTQVGPRHVLRQGPEFFARKTTRTGVLPVGQAQV